MLPPLSKLSLISIDGNDSNSRAKRQKRHDEVKTDAACNTADTTKETMSSCSYHERKVAEWESLQEDVQRALAIPYAGMMHRHSGREYRLPGTQEASS